MTRRALMAPLALCVLWSCENGGLQAPTLPGTNTNTPRDTQPPPPVGVEVDVGPDHGVDVLPPPVTPEAPVRSRRRMDLDQLGSSIRTVTGGIGWTETRGSTEVDLFQDLGATLGRPDFLEITTEDLEPSALFLKFMDDAARSVCAKVVTREVNGTDDTRALFIHIEPTQNPLRNADLTDRNLSALLLRYHGRTVPVGSPQLEHWRWLIRSVMQVNSIPVEAWRAVCVGLLTHPDFYSY